ncbi:MAG: signal peptide peptidase SppA [archaeon]
MNPPRSPNPSKPSSISDHDPRVTPWEEDEVKPHHTPPRAPQGRTLRDWAVLGIGFLLVLYVISFLLVGSSGSREMSGFTFGQSTMAIVSIQGEISSSTSTGTIGYQDVIDELEQADADPSVSVIFLDIDSAGGSVVASKQMVAKIRSVKKPVVSWIGEVGASGAYYAASASDYIVADSDSITGSIGVISRQPNVEKLLDNLGISMEEITSGKLKGTGSPFNEFTDEEKELFQTLINQAFEGFVSDVRAFRGEKLDELKFSNVLDGRILSGKQALEVGLIDQTGTREEAMLKAAELGGIEGKPGTVSYRKETFSFADLFFSAGSSFGEGLKVGVSKNAEASTGLSAK